MTLYNVHLYREMRLFFPGIEAAGPEEAAQIASRRPAFETEYTEDCDGQDLSALVDFVGDDQFEHSVMIDFEAERLRKAAPDMLHALCQFIMVDELANECGEWKWERLEHAFDLARAAIAKATTLPANQPERSTL